MTQSTNTSKISIVLLFIRYIPILTLRILTNALIENKLFSNEEGRSGSWSVRPDSGGNE